MSPKDGFCKLGHIYVCIVVQYTHLDVYLVTLIYERYTSIIHYGTIYAVLCAYKSMFR